MSGEGESGDVGRVHADPSRARRGTSMEPPPLRSTGIVRVHISVIGVTAAHETRSVV